MRRDERVGSLQEARRIVPVRLAMRLAHNNNRRQQQQYKFHATLNTIFVYSKTIIIKGLNILRSKFDLFNFEERRFFNRELTFDLNAPEQKFVLPAT